MQNKTNKVLIGTFVTFSALTALNSIISWKATRKKILFKEPRNYYYNWKQGKAFYSVQGKGKPLLLIHGIGAGSSSYEWHRNIKELSKNYKVYSLDLLGFGRSDKPRFTYTAFLYTQLIKDFIKDIIGEPTDIVASSLSSSFVIMSCYQNPNLFKKILLTCPTGIKKLQIYPGKKDLWLRKLIELPIIGTWIYNMISSKYSCRKFMESHGYYNANKLTEKTVHAYYESAHLKGSSSKYAVASFITNYMNTDIEKALETLDHSIYIVWGEESELTPVYWLDEFLKVNPSIESTVIENTRLLPHMEEPDYFNDICNYFFN